MARQFVRASSQNITVSSYSDIQPTDANNFTWGCWVYFDSLNTTQYILNLQRNTTNELVWGLRLDTTNNRFEFARGKQNIGEDTITSGSDPSTGQWYALIGTYDGTKIHLYVDGVEIGTGTTVTISSPTQTLSDFSIGQQYNGSNYHDGRIAEVFARVGTAWSLEQIKAFANGVKPHTLDSLDLYAPLYGIASPEANLAPISTKNNGTVTGATKADHAPVGRYAPMPSNPIPVSVQVARPDGDQTVGSWTDEGGATTNLYQSIDEAPPASDSDYVQSELSPSTSAYQATLSNVTDPQSSVGHILRYRYQRDSTFQTINLTVRLKQGATTIASATHNGVSDSWVDGSITLSTTEADNITDYTDLRVEFEASAA